MGSQSEGASARRESDVPSFIDALLPYNTAGTGSGRGQNRGWGREVEED